MVPAAAATARLRPQQQPRQARAASNSQHRLCQLWAQRRAWSHHQAGLTMRTGAEARAQWWQATSHLTAAWHPGELVGSIQMI